MKTLIKYYSSILAAFFILTNAYGSISHDKEGQPYLTKEFAINKPGELQVETTGGSIDVSAHESNTKLTDFDGQVEENKVVGSINGGGIPVEMSTSGGIVNLEYR